MQHSLDSSSVLVSGCWCQDPCIRQARFRRWSAKTRPALNHSIFDALDGQVSSRCILLPASPRSSLSWRRRGFRVRSVNASNLENIVEEALNIVEVRCHVYAEIQTDVMHSVFVRSDRDAHFRQNSPPSTVCLGLCSVAIHVVSRCSLHVVLELSTVDVVSFAVVYWYGA